MNILTGLLGGVQGAASSYAERKTSEEEQMRADNLLRLKQKESDRVYDRNRADALGDHGDAVNLEQKQWERNNKAKVKAANKASTAKAEASLSLESTKRQTANMSMIAKNKLSLSKEIATLQALDLEPEELSKRMQRATSMHKQYAIDKILASGGDPKDYFKMREAPQPDSSAISQGIMASDINPAQKRPAPPQAQQPIAPTPPPAPEDHSGLMGQIRENRYKIDPVRWARSIRSDPTLTEQEKNQLIQGH